MGPALGTHKYGVRARIVISMYRTNESVFRSSVFRLVLEPEPLAARSFANNSGGPITKPSARSRNWYPLDTVQPRFSEAGAANPTSRRLFLKASFRTVAKGVQL
jgi:hypothetical protein